MSYWYLMNLNSMPYDGDSFVGNLRAALFGDVALRLAAIACAGKFCNDDAIDGIGGLIHVRGECQPIYEGQLEWI